MDQYGNGEVGDIVDAIKAQTEALVKAVNSPIAGIEAELERLHKRITYMEAVHPQFFPGRQHVRTAGIPDKEQDDD